MALNMQQQITIAAWSIAFKNDREAVRRARREFNVTLLPSTVGKWRQRLLTTGNIRKGKPPGRPRTSTDAATTEAIVEAFESSPQKSTRQCARELVTSQSSVSRVLRRQKYRPFKPIRVQELNEDDPDRRLELCEFVLRENENDESWYKKLHFSDEAVFQVNGSVNRHNCHYYARENPQIIEEKRQKCGSVTVWAMIGWEGLLGLRIMDETVNGERYCEILNEIVVPVMRNVEHEHCLFQQDGAPPHYAIAAREILDRELPNRWVGRRGPVEWPARSPDLTACDYWLWGYLKERVYARKPRDINILRVIIEEEIRAIPVLMYQKTMRNFPKRCRLCCDVNGEQFEAIM